MIYAIEAGDCGPVKIGRAANPEARMAELQTGCPYTLTCIAAFSVGQMPFPVAFAEYEVEVITQAVIADSHLKGEWYRRTPEICLLTQLMWHPEAEVHIVAAAAAIAGIRPYDALHHRASAHKLLAWAYNTRLGSGRKR